MENAMLIQELRDKSLLDKKVKNVDPARVKAKMQETEIKKKFTEKKTEPQPKAPEGGSKEVSKPKTDNPKQRGIFVGIDSQSNKPFFKVVGKVSDLEYMSLVKYAEIQFNTTLELFKPASNLKLLQILEEMRNTFKEKDAA